MIPVTFDAATGQVMPGQHLGPELSRPGTSEANGMVTASGRYVVQKAELSTLFFHYMLQGNYNFFNTNEPFRRIISLVSSWSYQRLFAARNCGVAQSALILRLDVATWRERTGRRPISVDVLRALMVAWQDLVSRHLDGGDTGRETARAAAWELARLTVLSD